MHPDLFLILYRQRERELERDSLHRLAIQERGPSRVIRLSERLAILVHAVKRLRERTRLAAPQATCCATP